MRKADKKNQVLNPTDLRKAIAAFALDPANETYVQEHAEASLGRPKTRADCRKVPRPCPWASCKYNLYLEELPSGSLRLNFPDIALEDMPPEMDTCALDVVDRETHLDSSAVAAIMGLSRERISQIESRAVGLAAQGLGLSPPGTDEEVLAFYTENGPVATSRRYGLTKTELRRLDLRRANGLSRMDAPAKTRERLQERRQRILAAVKAAKSIRMLDLAIQLGVGQATIQADTNKLASEGLLRRTFERRAREYEMPCVWLDAIEAESH